MITIICNGSRGDIQPYLALAVEIQKQGGDVRIATGKSFRDFIKSYNIKHYPLSADYKSTEIDPKLLESAQNSTNPLKMLLTFRKMKKYARLMVDDMYNACIDSDLIIYHPGCTIGYFAGEKLGIPSVMASPFPMLKTNEMPSVINYGKTKMPNSLSYKLLHNMLFMASKDGVASFWKENFGKLPDNFSPPFERVDKNHPSIVSCSNYVFPRPTDWNENVHQYGYWFLNEQDNFTPPQDLVHFLGNGDKPIYFGFGSVFDDKDKNKFISTITEALKKTDKRGIICGMGEINNLPNNIFSIDNIPHTWLFPRCSAVCHHGGSGTTATGFSAGVPSIIIPFSNDQFAWAHRSYDIGVGSKPIYKKHLSTELLVDAINYVLSNHTVQSAKELGENIRNENGATSCASVIIKLL